MDQEKVKRTEKRIKQLRSYFESKLPGQREDLNLARYELRTVQPHIGLYYDSLANMRKSNESFRLLVMGLEALNEKGISIKQRTSQILEEASCTPKSNQHMKGTTLLLQIIFDLLGYQITEDEYIGEKILENHIFNYFALSNWHITGAFAVGSNKATRPRKMNLVAVRNFIRQVEILQPTLVILQSISIWLDYYIQKYGSADCAKWIGLKLEDYKSYNLLYSPDYSVYLPDANNIHKTLVIGFHHPASRGEKGKPWFSSDAPYLNNIIKPVLTKIICDYDKFINYAPK
ncbi:hypothetical protein JW887_06015 [Candidatus Dojkabacteria bacterium]|nr:hypothetical protein [Candidatus Dojkabacteria bacterium]